MPGTKYRSVSVITEDSGLGDAMSTALFLMDYDEGQGWHDARIVPFANISLHPASTVLHYGSEIFEGLKAYRRADGAVQLFRPIENIRRILKGEEAHFSLLWNREKEISRFEEK